MHATPLLAYRWEDTDRARADQLALEAEDAAVTLSPGQLAVRVVNPAIGHDTLPTIRSEMPGLRAGARSTPRQEVGSSASQAFIGAVTVSVADRRRSVSHGDVFAASPWVPIAAQAAAGATSLGLFQFSGTPIFEVLHIHREQTAEREGPDP